MIREARPHDAYGIAETHVITWQATYPGLVPDRYLRELSVPSRATFWQQRLQMAQGSTLVFEEDGRILAFVDVGRTREKDKNAAVSGELYAIYVRPDSQRRGLGRLLFERAINWARGQGFTEITTLVLKGNTPAHNFYLSMGMRGDGVEVRDQIGGQDVVEIRLMKQL